MGSEGGWQGGGQIPMPWVHPIVVGATREHVEAHKRIGHDDPSAVADAVEEQRGEEDEETDAQRDE